MDARPPPVVTVSDPSQPGHLAEALASFEEPAPPDPAVRRRQRRTAGTVLLLAGLVAAGAEVRERRATEAEERRLAGAVSLEATVTGAGADLQPDGSVQVSLSMRLFNSGPRAVTVVGGAVGEFTSEDDVVVPQARAATLVLSMTAVCPTERPPAGRREAVLALDVRTGSSVLPHQVALPQDAGGEIFAQACGWGPLPQSVHLASPGAVDAGGALTLEVGAVTRAPVRLIALVSEADSGVTLTAPELAAGPVPLPRWSTTESPVRTVQALVAITDCTAARAAVATGGAVVTGVFEDVNGERAQSGLLLDAALLARRLDAACS